MASAPAMALSKNEVVYASLAADGRAQSVYVVNRFEVDQAQSVTDYGVYSQVINLTDLSPVTLRGDVVTAQASRGIFYYQGNMLKASLPWQFELHYSLDGRAVSAREIAGQSGSVQISIAVNPQQDGEAVFLDHYTLQMSLTLDSERCTHIQAPGATVANAGQNRQLTYMVLPGEQKTFTITLDAQGFAMSALSINGVPLSLDVDGAVDTAQMKDKVAQLQDGIGELDDGADQLRAAARKLQKGAQALKEGSGQVTGGIAQIKSGSAALTQAAAQVDQQLNELAAGLKQLKGSTAQLKAGGEKLETSAKALAQGAGQLEEALGQIKSAAAGAGAALSSLSQAAGSCGGEISILRSLLSKSQQNADVRTYLAEEIKALGKVLTTLEALDEGLNQLSALYGQFTLALDQAASAAAELKKGASQLAQGVNDFTEPAVKLAGAVGDIDTGGAQMGQFEAGLQQLDAAVGQLQEKYKALDAGIQKLDGGTGALRSGTKQLAGGTGELKEETADLDQQVDNEVDKALNKFRTGAFEPVSFVDPRNQVELVQFVIKTEAVEAIENKAEQAPQEQAPLSFHDKLAALFGGWRDGR